MIIFYKFIIFA